MAAMSSYRPRRLQDLRTKAMGQVSRCHQIDRYAQQLFQFILQRSQIEQRCSR